MSSQAPPAAVPGRRRTSLPAWHRPLEILGLWAIASVQPLLALIGENASFLLHHRVDGVDLALWCLLVVIAPPALAWGLEAAVEWLRGRAAAARLHRLLLGAIVALLVLGALRKLGDPLPGWTLLPLVGLLVWLVAVLSGRWVAVRSFFAFLVLTLPLSLALFWISPAAEAARGSAERRSGPPSSADIAGSAELGGGLRAAADLPPVVLVVFDELPLLSLLDRDLSIDRHLCPNLAQFASEATWYRNASTVWAFTSPSIASLLTGRVVPAGTPPTLERLPRNLLTWLGSTHEVRARELTTSLAPASSGGAEPLAPRRERLAELGADSVIVAAHLFAPPALAARLPPIDDRWGGFRHSRVIRGRGASRGEPGRQAPWAFALADGRARDFAAFVESIGRRPSDVGGRPVAYFAHVMLPHMPYRYLPSGRVYGGRSVTEDGARAWRESEWFALETYQRHMLQVGFVDRLVGELVGHLRATGLWDEALVILTADHGVSHWPGEDRRKPTETRHPEDIWRVPLLIKAPHQSTGRIDDRPALSIDVVPTVAALLGAVVDWPVEGRALTGDELTASERLVRVDGGRAERVIDHDPRPDGESLARKLELFDPAAGDLRWVRLGPYRSWIGRTVGEAARLAAAAPGLSCRAEIDQESVIAQYDPESGYSPALLTGALECDGDLPSGAYLVAAVNGRLSGADRLEPIESDRSLFGVMTAEASWRAGSNRVELYLASSEAGATRLRPIERR